jgi:hypothetical protein
LLESQGALTVDNQLEAKKDVLRAIVEGIRQVLGDISTPKQCSLAKAILNRQCEHLIALDPGYAEALRAVITERITALIPDPEIREKMLTDPRDPFHLQWLLTATDYTIRHYGRNHADADGKPTGLAALIGHLRIERPDDDTPES